MRIAVIDYVILSDDSCYSFAEERLLHGFSAKWRITNIGVRNLTGIKIFKHILYLFS